MTINDIRTRIENEHARSAWDRGVNLYACELLDGLDAVCFDLEGPEALRSALLNGADSWDAYSWGGCSLIYDCNIAERLCTPSELKRTRNGERRPNSREEWLDVQARALFQAANRIDRIARGLKAQEVAQ